MPSVVFGELTEEKELAEEKERHSTYRNRRIEATEIELS